MYKYIIVLILSLLAYFVNGSMFEYQIDEIALCIISCVVFLCVMYFDHTLKPVKAHLFLGVALVIVALILWGMGDENRAALALVPIAFGMLVDWGFHQRRKENKISAEVALVENVPVPAPVASRGAVIPLAEREQQIVDRVAVAVADRLSATVMPSLREELRTFYASLVYEIDKIKSKTIADYTELKTPEEVDEILLSAKEEIELLQERKVAELEEKHNEALEGIKREMSEKEDVLRQEISELEGRRDSLEQKVKKSKKDKIVLEKLVRSLENSYAELDGKIADIRAAGEAEKEALRNRHEVEMQEIIATSQQELESLRREIEEKNAKLKQFEALLAEQDGDLQDILKQRTGSRMTFIANATIRHKLQKAVKETKVELDILCPWVTKGALASDNMSLISDMRSTLEKTNSCIKIRYGINDFEQKEYETELGVEFLQYNLPEFVRNGRLRFKEGNSHGKLLLCDDQYLIIGSFNFLSFAGKYYKTTRDEIAVIIEDPNTVRRLRSQYFDF